MSIVDMRKAFYEDLLGKYPGILHGYEPWKLTQWKYLWPRWDGDMHLSLSTDKDGVTVRLNARGARLAGLESLADDLQNHLAARSLPDRFEPPSERGTSRASRWIKLYGNPTEPAERDRLQRWMVDRLVVFREFLASRGGA